MAGAAERLVAGEAVIGEVMIEEAVTVPERFPAVGVVARRAVTVPERSVPVIGKGA